MFEVSVPSTFDLHGLYGLIRINTDIYREYSPNKGFSLRWGSYFPSIELPLFPRISRRQEGQFENLACLTDA